MFLSNLLVEPVLSLWQHSFLQEETQLNLTNILFKYIYALSSFGQHGKSLLSVGKAFWGLGIGNVGIRYSLIFLQEYMYVK